MPFLFLAAASVACATTGVVLIRDGHVTLGVADLVLTIVVWATIACVALASGGRR